MGLAGILAALLSLAFMAAVLGLGYGAYVTRRIARQAERLVPPPGRFVEIDGARIHYVERGEGPPILMVHGLGGSLHQMLRPLMEEFGDGYRLIALDRPGSGYSTRGRGQVTLAEQARFLCRFMDRLGIDKPMIVGHSLGGAVALATAIDHPERVAGLALISPLTHEIDEPPAAFGPLAVGWAPLRRLVAETVATPLAIRNSRTVLGYVFGPQEPPPDYAVKGGAMALLRPSHFDGTSTDFAALRGALAPYEARYGEIGVPCGVVFGTADRILDHRRHGLPMAHRIRNIEFEILEGVGHMPQYVDTERVVAFVRRIAERAFAP